MAHLEALFGAQFLSSTWEVSSLLRLDWANIALQKGLPGGAQIGLLEALFGTPYWEGYMG